MISLDRNYREATNLLFASLGYIWIYLKLRKYCKFGGKNSRREWCVVPAQEINRNVHTVSLKKNILLVRNFAQIESEPKYYYALD